MGGMNCYIFPDIKHDLSNILIFIIGGDIVIDTELIRIRQNFQMMLTAVVQYFFIGIANGHIIAYMKNACA